MMGIVGIGTSSPTSVRMQTSCGSLLSELQHIWTEIGETESDKNRYLLELEMECLEIYRRKVDEASNAKAHLHQSVAAKEAELAALRASLGEHTLHSQMEKKLTSLKEQLASVMPLLEELRTKKEERVKQFADIRSQIERITGEISGYSYSNDTVINHKEVEEFDFSVRKLNEYQAQLQSLQKEKSDRLHKVLEYVNEVHCLCGVLGMDFGNMVDEVHPSLHETDTGQTTNISNSTLQGLSQTILKLKKEKKARFQKLRDTMASLFELWNLMDSSEEERRPFRRVTCVLGSPEHDIKDFGVLLSETIEQTEAEVERLTKLKASRMKELVLKRWLELEEVCRWAHIEPDMSTAPEKSNVLIDSGIMDPSELVANIEAQIVKAKEESISRKEIMDRIGRWLTACEEENWLEHYNQDGTRYSAGRGVHLNLKRAERARVTVTKIPGIVDNLMHRTLAWEGERNKPFLYDGVQLVSILEEYKLARQQREEEKRRYRDQKKLQDMLVKEAMYGSKPSPKRINSLNRTFNGGYHANGNGSMTPTPQHLSAAGGATPELLTPRSYTGRQNGYFKEMRRMSTAPVNYVTLSKEDAMSPFASSVCGSELETPPWTSKRR